MKIQKNNTGILITKTAKQPRAKIEFSLDELDALSEFCERLQDEKDIREYLNTAVTIPDSAEVSAPIAAKYLRDAALFEQLVDETRRNQEENQSNFLTAVSDAVSSIEKSHDVKEWHGLTKETAERFAREFMAERNPGRWSGFGEVPESVSLDPLNFPINDIYPKGNKPALRMQLISVTYPSLHRVCECSIIEDGVDLWARRTLDSMTAGTVEDLVETVLYVCLAMGLPPTHIHDLASEYDKYFGRDGRRVVFTYNNVDFEVRIVRVMVFPQGVAAIAPYMSKIMARPEAYTYIIDIGGYTTDVVKFSRGGQVDMAFCESFNNGVIKMYDEVQRAVRNHFQLDVDDYTIDNILRCGYNPGKELNDVVHTTAQNYAHTLIRSLKEKGVDLTLSYPVFIGGGSILMRPVIESELGRDDYLFIDDPRANAIGYKMMAESRLAAENR